MIVTGADYKSAAWVYEHFVKFLADRVYGVGFEGKSLSQLVEAFPNDWGDFCVLEGISVAF